MDANEHSKDLARRRERGLEKLCGVLGISADALGVAAAAAGISSTAAAAGSAGVIAAVASEVRERRQKRHFERLERLVGSLALRLNKVETELSDSPSVDLFEEFMAKAIIDEDEMKLEIYSAYLEWVLSLPQTQYDARVLGDAIRSLSFQEIKVFVRWGHGEMHPRILRGLVDDKMFWRRVEAVGLYGGGGSVNHQNNITRIGSVLVDIAEDLV